MSARAWQHRRGQLDLDTRPLVMGILNVTPDSFSDGGQFADPTAAVEGALAMVTDGADIVDVGGVSTRPGADPVPENVELARVVPVIETLRARSDVVISVDTTRASVAAAAIEVGADIVNDISAMRFDAQMVDTVAKAGAGVVLMHTTGKAQVVHENPRYDDVSDEVLHHLEGRVRVATDHGVPRQNIVIDPGFGFGKNVDHNYVLLAELPRFVSFGLPVLVGASRKRMVRDLVGQDAHAVEHGSTAVNLLGMAAGARVIRVHDVRAARAAVSIFQRFERAS